MGIERITCIQLGGEFPDYCHRLVMPEYGITVIGTILSEAGYDVEIYVEHIRPPEWNRMEKSDLICFSSTNAAADKTYRLAQEIKARVGIPVIVGGTHASYFPEMCLQHCDYVVFGEGDETILELVEVLAKGRDVNKVAGIAYRLGDEVHRTAPRSGPDTFDTVPNYSLINGYPRMGLFDILIQGRKPLLTVQSSRGCPFRCSFCIVQTMFSGGYRKRGVDSVIKDLRDKRQYGRDLLFVDNEFSASRPYTKDLLRKMVEEDFGFDIVVLARVEIANDDELLHLMRKAGISYMYQGYESIQPETLISYNKRQTPEQIVQAIDKLHSFGFGILGSFVVGADTDTLETMGCTVDFVLDHKLSNAYFFPLWGHFPERANGFQTIIPWYRSIFRGWGYCNGNYVTHFPLHMPPSALQRAIVDAYRRIYSPGQIAQALKRGAFRDAKRKILYRYQWNEIEKGFWEYIDFLEQLETGLYDSGGNLNEGLLLQRVKKDPRWVFPAGDRTDQALELSSTGRAIPGTEDILCSRT